MVTFCLQAATEGGGSLDVEPDGLNPGLLGVGFGQGAAAARKADDRELDPGRADRSTIRR